MNRSILITNKEININKMIYPIFWYNNISSRNTHFPKEYINILNCDSDWVNQLGNKEDIIGLFITCDLDSIEYLKLGEFYNLQELYIYTANNLEDISFLEKLHYLRDLMIINSKIDNLFPLRNLILRQQTLKAESEKYLHILKNIAIIDAEVRDLTCFSKVRGAINELNLSGNKIKDLTPLSRISISHFSIEHNEIVDLEIFMQTHKMIRLINVRHNKIKSIEFMRGKQEMYYIKKLYLMGNKITDMTPLQDYALLTTDIEKICIK